MFVCDWMNECAVCSRNGKWFQLRFGYEWNQSVSNNAPNKSELKLIVYYWTIYCTLVDVPNNSEKKNNEKHAIIKSATVFQLSSNSNVSEHRVERIWSVRVKYCLKKTAISALNYIFGTQALQLDHFNRIYTDTLKPERHAFRSLADFRHCNGTTAEGNTKPLHRKSHEFTC